MRLRQAIERRCRSGKKTIRWMDCLPQGDRDVRIRNSLDSDPGR
jgi:hypothetical protein